MRGALVWAVQRPWPRARALVLKVAMLALRRCGGRVLPQKGRPVWVKRCVASPSCSPDAGRLKRPGRRRFRRGPGGQVCVVTQDLLLAIPLPCCKVRACLLVGRMFSQAVSPSCPLVGATTRTWALPSPAPRLVLFSAGRVQRLPPGGRTPRLSVGAACRGFGGSASDSLPSENNHSRHYGARVPCTSSVPTSLRGHRCDDFHVGDEVVVRGPRAPESGLCPHPGAGGGHARLLEKAHRAVCSPV